MPNDDSKVPPGDDAETQSFGDVPAGEVLPAMPDDDNTIPADPDKVTQYLDKLPSAALPRKIGHYSIKRIIASGGMGTVYLAQQENPRRVVALKVMKASIASKSALRRFKYESQILARLKHRNIAQVFEAGTHDDGEGGTPFFAMEYVRNARTITEYVSEKKLSTHERLELFKIVCDAVHHGHLKGIIHRDLKPGNILVDSDGEPTIIDFGVARAIDSDMTITTLQTNIGQLIGTMQYMSPEQCDADPTDLDARSDIYALGVLLYELLTDRLPYDLSKVAIYEAARVIKEEQPPRPSSINKKLRGDLEFLTLKTLHKDRKHRYQSAEALGDDISRYLNHEPISARRTSLSYLLSALIWRIRVSRPRPTRRNVIVYCLTLILLGTPTAGWAYWNFIYDPFIIVTEAAPLENMISNISTHHINWLYDFRIYKQRLEFLVSSNKDQRFYEPLRELRDTVMAPLEEEWDSRWFNSRNYFPEVSDNFSWQSVLLYSQGSNVDITIFTRSQFEGINSVNEFIELNHQRLWIWTANRLQSQISYLEKHNWPTAQSAIVLLEDSIHTRNYILKMRDVEVAIDTHRMLQTIDETWQLVEEIRLAASSRERTMMISIHSTLQAMMRKQPSVQLIYELIILHKPVIEEVHRLINSDKNKYDWRKFYKEFTTPDDWTMEDFRTWCDIMESHRIPDDG